MYGAAGSQEHCSPRKRAAMDISDDTTSSESDVELPSGKLLAENANSIASFVRRSALSDDSRLDDNASAPDDDMFTADAACVQVYRLSHLQSPFMLVNAHRSE